MKLIVLMSTYNGEKYLREQLDSLLAQKHMPDKIVVRDDGSSDGTLTILEEYRARDSRIEYRRGENRGPAGSFYELIRDCEDADYYALCDQDDVWMPDKLSAAVEALKKEDESIPLLYCSRYTLTDEKLNPIDSNVSPLYNYSDFPHSLIYHTAPGCTFVFNHKAREKVISYDMEKEYCLIHDAIIHKVVCMFGKMILDPASHMYYRQHRNNEIGMSADKLKVFSGRIRRFLNGKIRNYRSLTAEALLRVYGKECSAENRELLQTLAYYQKDRKLKKRLLNDERLKTGTVNDLFFRFLVLVNYI
ncbi:MAG: glycosyltransferase family 2 protein [Erysipelotrichaceae bacterium]|nr:glycosyltransferase family 2 protein [Erysipelotrichaceae bacterium]